MQDDLDAELEALEAVYDEQVQLVCRWPLSLRLRLLPSTCGDATLRFVKATLWIEADDEYPRTRPELHICDAKGLGDHRASRLLSRLRQFMVEQPTEPLLGSLCQTALELITADNSPDGDCCICLRARDAQTTPLFLLTTCYHCFHTDCARAYVGWRDKNPPEEAPMHLRVGSDYVEPPLFQCPVCRRVPGDADLERVKALKAGARAASEAMVGASAGGEGDDEVSLLSEAMLEELLLHQKRMALLRDKQSAKGGLVGMRDPPPASEAQPPALSEEDGQDTRAGKGGKRRGRYRQRVGPIAPEPSAGASDGRLGERGGCLGGDEGTDNGSGGRGRGRGRGGGEAATVGGSRGRGRRRGRGRGVARAESPTEEGQERNQEKSGCDNGGGDRVAQAAS